ncbi:hematopoietic death receptor isoform X2 [Scleropages formosus]|uniref:hematopoietic death receptor isoform X2 n=1 Tax=Scleropages formosus TaxID=113540 RepID=UPI0008787B6B|nr:tumor necrosis factor receptor superfamily member 10A-like isoform X2 [Scleropages formosus]
MSAKYMVVSLLLALTIYPAVKLSLGAALRDRTARHVLCQENLEYPHESHCCLNCPAGQFVKEACTKPLTRGTCAACPYDTYTEHDNGLMQCLQCTKCRTDEEVTRQCSNTQNSQCQCKSGSFCSPDQACEFCKKCSRCKPDEETVKNCTSTSNTVCKKKIATSATVLVTVGVIIPVIVAVGVVLLIYLKKKLSFSNFTVVSCKSSEVVKVNMDDKNNTTLEEEERQSAGPLEPQQEREPFLKESPPVGANDDGLGSSITSSSQTSLTSQHTPPCCCRSPHPNPVALRQPTVRVHSQRRRLIPLNGQESLKKSFDLFEELDINYHNRFFRRIGLKDNEIQGADNQSPADKMYELLRLWMEKEGSKADINDLLEVLFSLDQKLSAETIIHKAITNCDFVYEDVKTDCVAADIVTHHGINEKPC